MNECARRAMDFVGMFSKYTPREHESAREVDSEKLNDFFYANQQFLNSLNVTAKKKFANEEINHVSQHV